MILAYKIGNTWMFDDHHRGISGEPFVSGASEMFTFYVERVIKERYPDMNPNFCTILFSLHQMPDYDILLSLYDYTLPLKRVTPLAETRGKSKVRQKYGNTYAGPRIEYVEDEDATPTSGYFVTQAPDSLECWLCPAQLAYFGQVPDHVFIRLEPWQGEIPEDVQGNYRPYSYASSSYSSYGDSVGYSDGFYSRLADRNRVRSLPPAISDEAEEDDDNWYLPSRTGKPAIEATDEDEDEDDDYLWGRTKADDLWD